MFIILKLISRQRDEAKFQASNVYAPMMPRSYPDTSSSNQNRTNTNIHSPRDTSTSYGREESCLEEDEYRGSLPS